MTIVEWSVFCEGKSDKVFLECLARYLRILNIEFVRIGGGVSHLKSVAPEDYSRAQQRKKRGRDSRRKLGPSGPTGRAH